MAEIGVLEVLSQAGVPIHCVAGTSAGAAVGAAFASGGLEGFRDCLSSLTRRGVLGLFDPVWPREGLLHGRRALEFIRTHIGERIEDLPLRYAAVATDLRTGEEVLLRDGSVADAVRASIAIPGIFTPWRIRGRPLVDGGLVDPVPVSAARALGADFVIAVNVLRLRDARDPSRSTRDHLRMVGRCGNPAAPGDEDTKERLGLTEILWQSSNILSSQVASARLREDRPEYVFHLDVPEIGMFDVHRTAELAEIGRQAANEGLPSLLRRIRRAAPLRHRVRQLLRRARESAGTERSLAEVLDMAGAVPSSVSMFAPTRRRSEENADR
jgi:NTE family protein